MYNIEFGCNHVNFELFCIGYIKNGLMFVYKYVVITSFCSFVNLKLKRKRSFLFVLIIKKFDVRQNNYVE